MKTSFVKTDEPPVTQLTPIDYDKLVAEEPTKAATPSTVTVFADYEDSDECKGEYNASDIILPRLNLVGKSGELSDNWPKNMGDYVYNKEVLVGTKENQLLLVVRSLKKFWQKDVKWGSDEEATRYKTVEEVRNNGGTVEWDQKNEFPYYVSVGELVVLIKGPKDHPIFPFEFSGNNPIESGTWALAKWSLSNAAYKSAGRQIYTDGGFVLKKKYSNGLYTASSELKKGNGNSWYVPVVKLLSKSNSPEFIEFIQNLAV